MSKFTVVLQDVGGLHPINAVSASSSQEAKSMAKKWAREYPDKLVFIEYFRPGDGQHGYINRDGFDITGKSWTDL